jgi:hypothetical protein
VCSSDLTCIFLSGVLAEVCVGYSSVLHDQSVFSVSFLDELLCGFVQD